ncbi:MAG TPA: hypothetical protein VEO01_31350, partial [Pseudonocardiaceae bacterium]|nr:hypothetical protein [Pseudonocardiaceae bacterium]
MVPAAHGPADSGDQNARKGHATVKRRRIRRSLTRLAGFVAVVVGAIYLLPLALAATQTVVSLTFDNGAVSEYTLGYQQALQPHGVAGTFFVNSGTVGG